MRQKSHTSLVQKGWGLGLNSTIVLLLFLILPSITALTSGNLQMNTTDIYNIKLKVYSYNSWHDLIIKHGLIGEGSQLVYSEQLKKKDITFKTSWINYQDYDTITNQMLKFSIQTSVPAEYMGFFYEFITPQKAQYFGNYQTMFVPYQYHIILKDLYKKYDDILILDNKVLIYTHDNKPLYDFDPLLEDDGIPIDCVVNTNYYYNLTFINDTTEILAGQVFNMSAWYDYSGVCSGFKLTWEDNTTGIWTKIPNLDMDLMCMNEFCGNTAPSNNVWYSRNISYDETLGNYSTRFSLSYNNHLGALQNISFGRKYLNCVFSYSPVEPTYERKVVNYYPANNSFFNITTNILDSFVINASSNVSGDRLLNLSLYHNTSGTWINNNTWKPHFHNVTGKVLFTAFFNMSNRSEEGYLPISANSNKSLNIENVSFFDDYSLNVSWDKGCINYSDTLTMNLTFGTICLWLKPHDKWDSTKTHTIWQDYANGNENIYLAWDSANLDFGFKKEHLNNNYYLLTIMNTAAKSNEWFHLCIAWDNSYTQIFVNGTQRASTIGRLAPTTKQGGWQLGAIGTDSCNCSIDEMIIFDRRLSSTEIMNTYLADNRSLNVSNQGTLLNGSYAYYGLSCWFPSMNCNASNYNYTFTIGLIPTAAGMINIPYPLLLHDTKTKPDYVLVISFLAISLVWLIIIFLLLWYRRKGKAHAL